jgi:hypothetical protein
MDAIKADVGKTDEAEDIKPEVVKEDIVARVRQDMTNNKWLDFVDPVCQWQRDHLHTQPESRLLALLQTATVDLLKETPMDFLQVETPPTGFGIFGRFVDNAQWNQRSWYRFLQSVCHHL